MGKVKFINAAQAAELIRDNDSVCVNGFLMANAAEEVFKAIESRFLTTGHPKNLKLMFTGSVGDGTERGINHFAHEGLIRECFGAHYGVMRTLSPLILGNKIKAYNVPQGITIHLYRAMGSHLPGVISHVGLNTFVDPDLEGGKLNDISDEEYVRKIQVDGKDYLFYKNPGKIDVAVIRGTEADEDGNISFRKEALKLDSIPIAIAAKNSGGKVIVQVERIVRRGTLDPKEVVIPRIWVDCVCVIQDKVNHMQTGATQFDEDFASSSAYFERPRVNIPFSIRKIIARRCAMLLGNDDFVLNYGIGMPELVSAVLGEEGVSDKYVTTIESGVVGGIAQAGLDFGVARYPEALIDAPYQFDFYQGGGIDMAFLGLAECDKDGNINVSKFGRTIVTGSGGFIDIAQNSKSVVFCGTFMAKGSEIVVKDGKLDIVKEGTGSKFVERVQQVTFSGKYASKSGQKVYAVTERALFQLGESGWILKEVAPGVDIQKDILAHMKFQPEVPDHVKLMDSRIFMEKAIGLSI